VAELWQGAFGGLTVGQAVRPDRSSGASSLAILVKAGATVCALCIRLFMDSVATDVCCE